MTRWLSPRTGLVLVTLLYVLAFPYHAGMRSPNELCRMWQSRSLIDTHTLNINQTLQQYGMVGDLSCTLEVKGTDGSTHLERCVGEQPTGPVVAQFYYPSKAPLVSVLGAPVYAALKLLGPVNDVNQAIFSRLFVTILPTLVMLVFLRRFLNAYVSEGVSEVVCVTYALGTMAFSYAEAFMSHQLTAVLIFGCLYSAWRAVRGELKPWAFAVAGACAGATLTSEYTGAIGILAIASFVVAALWNDKARLLKAVALVTLGALPFVVGLMAYHQACFGGPFVSGYKFLNDAAYQGWHVGGFLGIRYPDPRAFWLSFFSPLRGLFALSPFLVMAFIGLRPLWQRERALGIAGVVVTVATAYFTSSFTYDSWGWTTGPRHMTPMLPLFIVPVALILQKWVDAPGAARSIAAGLCVSSVIATGLVVGVNYIPEDISTSVWGLAVPLLQQSHWPVTALAVVIPNPLSGMLLVALLVVASVWLAMRFRQLGALPVMMAVAVVLHLGALKLFTRGDDHDVGAQNFLKSVWQVPNDAKLKLWP